MSAAVSMLVVTLLAQPGWSLSPQNEVPSLATPPPIMSGSADLVAYGSDFLIVFSWKRSDVTGLISRSDLWWTLYNPRTRAIERPQLLCASMEPEHRLDLPRATVTDTGVFVAYRSTRENLTTLGTTSFVPVPGVRPSCSEWGSRTTVLSAKGLAVAGGASGLVAWSDKTQLHIALADGSRPAGNMPNTLIGYELGGLVATTGGFLAAGTTTETPAPAHAVHVSLYSPGGVHLQTLQLHELLPMSPHVALIDGIAPRLLVAETNMTSWGMGPCLSEYKLTMPQPGPSALAVVRTGQCSATLNAGELGPVLAASWPDGNALWATQGTTSITAGALADVATANPSAPPRVTLSGLPRLLALATNEWTAALLAQGADDALLLFQGDGGVLPSERVTLPARQTPQHTPSLARDGDDWLLLWQTVTKNGLTWRLARLDRDGGLSDVGEVTTPDGVRLLGIDSNLHGSLWPRVVGPSPDRSQEEGSPRRDQPITGEFPMLSTCRKELRGEDRLYPEADRI